MDRSDGAIPRRSLPVAEAGASFLPAEESQGGTIEREGLFWEHEGNWALRNGQWKLVAKGPRGKWELYDMVADRTELHDLADRERERTAAMAENWHEWARRTRAMPWPWK